MIQNPDLPISVVLPGVYVYLSLIGIAPTQAPTRVLFLSYKTSAGVAQAGTLFPKSQRRRCNRAVRHRIGPTSLLSSVLRTGRRNCWS